MNKITIKKKTVHKDTKPRLAWPAIKCKCDLPADEQ